MLSALALGAAPRALASEEPVAIPLIEDGPRFLVDVGVNEGRGYRFVLDTGATTHFISADLARGLALPRVDSRIIRAHDGRAVRPVVGLSRMEVGGLPLRDVRAVIWSAQAMGGRDGMVGFPILRPRAVLDLSIRRLLIGAATPQGAVRVPAEVSASEVVLIGGPPGAPGRFVFDTGAAGLVISPAYLERLRASAAFAGAQPRMNQGRIVGLELPQLEFGPLTLSQARMQVADSRASGEMFQGVDGLFGAAYIRRFAWAIDTEAGALHAVRTAAT